MDYDDSSRRLNLLSGVVFGAALGAGLALLFLPEPRLRESRRVVVKTARRIGRTARHSLEDAADRARTFRERAASLHLGRDDDGEDDEEDGDETAAVGARARTRGMVARRRFKL